MSSSCADRDEAVWRAAAGHGGRARFVRPFVGGRGLHPKKSRRPSLSSA